MFHSEMKYRSLGKCGTKVSALSLGGWTTFGGSINDEELIRTLLLYAYEQGINFFDIADIYAKGEAERVMGKVLGELPREELIISSKLYWPMSEDVNDRGLSRKHILESVHKSLKRIGTDYLDLYFCHRFDEQTPLEETICAMDDLIHQGKILYWGTSEWSAQQISAAHEICEKYNLYKPQVEQPQFSLLVRNRVEKEIRPIALEKGMGLVVWSPLASGLLSGKYDEKLPEGSRLARIEWLRDNVRTPENVALVKRFKGLADEVGCTRSQLALAWNLNQEGISSVITGATKLAQLQENLGALKIKYNSEIEIQINQIFSGGK